MFELKSNDVAMVSGGMDPLSDSQLSNVYVTMHHNPYWSMPFTFYNLRNW